jgi:hypothetical protein
MKAGAKEIRVAGISPDPADNSYLRATRLLVKMPKEAGARATVVRVMSAQSQKPVTDDGADWVPMEFGQ